MFEKFSGSARAAVAHAQDVARANGSRQIDSRHLLVALLEMDSPSIEAVRVCGTDPADVIHEVSTELRDADLSPSALASLGIDLAAIKEKAEETFGKGALDPRSPSGGHIPFTKDAKGLLQNALRETVRLKRKRIDGTSILLGMLATDTPARQSLVNAGVDIARLCAMLEQAPAA